jgi:hypothetical protein
MALAAEILKHGCGMLTQEPPFLLMVVGGEYTRNQKRNTGS